MNETWNNFYDWVRATFGPSLRAWHEPLDRWIDGLPPSAGRVCAVAVFVIAAICILSLKTDYIYLGAPDRARWRDLRIWALLVLIPYMAVYWWL